MHAQGVFISRVSHDGPSQQAGLQVGDKVLAVNQHSLVNADHHRAVDVLKAAGNDVTMVVERPARPEAAASSENARPNARLVNGSEVDGARLEVRETCSEADGARLEVGETCFAISGLQTMHIHKNSLKFSTTNKRAKCDCYDVTVCMCLQRVVAVIECDRGLVVTSLFVCSVWLL